MDFVRGAAIRAGFRPTYSKYLDKAVQNQKGQEDAVYSSPEYKKLSAQVDDLQKSTKAQDEDIAKQIALLDEQRAALGDAFKDARGKIGHLVYQYEIVPRGRQERQSESSERSHRRPQGNLESGLAAGRWENSAGQAVHRRRA